MPCYSGRKAATAGRRLDCYFTPAYGYALYGGFGFGSYSGYGGFNAYGPYGGFSGSGWGWGGAF